MDILQACVGQGGLSEPCSTGEVNYVDSLLSTLSRRQQRAKAELDSITAAINALRANPEVANILELISKAGR